MANIFLDASETFTLADSDNSIFGRAGGTETVQITAGTTGTTTDANVEGLDLSANLADHSFEVTANGLEISTGGNVVATIPSLNQDLDLRAADGNITLSQTGAQTFTAANPNDDTDTQDIAAGDAAASLGVGAGDDASNLGPAPTVPTFSVSGAGSVDEGGTATFTVSLNEVATEETSVDFAVNGEGGLTVDDHGDITVDGTVDNSGSGTLTFAPGETSKTITIPVVTDNETPEDGEALSVSLSNASDGAEIDAASVSTAINDQFPFTLSQSQDSVEEGDTITFTLTANAPVTEDTDVAFSVVPGDASANNQGTNDTNLNDFDQGSFNPSNVTIAEGETEAEFTLTTQTDSITELPEDFILEAEVNGQTVSNTVTLLDGSGFTLTSDTDAFTGDANADVFSAGLGTIQTGDVLEGLGGNDTLNARISTDIGDGDPTAGTEGPVLDSVDVVNVDSRGSGTNQFEVDRAIGLNTFTVTGTAGVTSTGFTSDLSTVSLKGNATDGAFDSTVGIEFIDDQLTADDDALTVNLDNVSGGTLEIGAQASTGTNELETLNLASNGTSANSLTLDPTATGFPTAALDDVNTFNVTGDQDLTLTTAIANVTTETVDASGHNGTFTLNLTGTSGQALDLDDFTGVDRIVADATGGTFQLDNAPDGVDLTLTGNAPTTVTVNIPGAGLPGTQNSVNVTLDNATDETDVDVTNLTATGVETINLTSNGGLQDGSEENSIGSLASTNLNNLNITGDTDTSITTGDVGSEFAIDGSGLTGSASLTVDADANTGGGVSITGAGSADDLTGTGQDDVINAGAGDDANVDAGVGQDIVTLGAGADTYAHGATGDSTIDTNNFTMTAVAGDTPNAGETAVGLDVITDFATGSGGDTLTFSGTTNADAGTMGQVEDDEFVVVAGQFDSASQTFTVGDGTTDDETNGDALVLFDGEPGGTFAAADIEGVVLEGVDIVGSDAVSASISGTDLTFA